MLIGQPVSIWSSCWHGIPQKAVSFSSKHTCRHMFSSSFCDKLFILYWTIVSYENIFLSNGVSLHQFASSLKKNYAKRANKNAPGCIGCRKDGNLSICGRFPRPLYNGRVYYMIAFYISSYFSPFIVCAW